MPTESKKLNEITIEGTSVPSVAYARKDRLFDILVVSGRPPEIVRAPMCKTQTNTPYAVGYGVGKAFNENGELNSKLAT